jgi:hypothetical protein
MTRTPEARAPEVLGIDLRFRPATYFWPLGLETHLLARIKGAERRATVKHLIQTKGLDAIPAFLAQSTLSDADRQALGRIHPAFMGGEYLPDQEADEVEIARITIASTTQDVTSIYARRGRSRIRYRAVDEYGGQTLSTRTTRSSTRPLMLGEVEAFFNGAWSIFEVLEENFGRDYDVDEMLQFVVGVDSEFYPQIGTLYRRRIEAWAALRREKQPRET